MMEQTKKPFSKEEVLAVLEQLMSEMGTMDKLDMPEEAVSEEEISELPELEEKPSLVVAIGSEGKEEEESEPYMKSRAKGQLYK